MDTASTNTNIKKTLSAAVSQKHERRSVYAQHKTRRAERAEYIGNGAYSERGTRHGQAN